MKKEKFEKAVARLAQMFETDEFPEQLAFTIIRKEKGDVKPSDKWSLLNRLIQLVVGETTDSRTFLQWKAVGRYVRKGEKSFSIFAPNTKKQEDDNGEEKVVVIGYHTLPVFGIEQTDGEPLPIFDYTPPKLPLDTEVLIKAIEGLGCKVRFDAMRRNALGYYKIGMNEIVLSTPDFAVLAHEGAHFVHDTIEDIKEVSGNKAEVVAELTAAVICSVAGVNGYERQSREYIKHYADNMDTKELLRTMNDVLKLVEKIVTTLVDAMEEVNK